MQSTPGLEEFTPLPHQKQVIKDIRRNFDYDRGVQEVLLSGSVGSAKSLLIAHIIVTHCLLYPGSVFGIGRLALPRLKETLAQKIREHLYNSRIDFKYNETKGSFELPGRSKIIAFSWADKNFNKFRSYELSGMAIEEVVENPTKDPYEEALMRVGRLQHVPEKLMISASNPGSPMHWAYKRLVENPSVHTYYSRTADNPYLPNGYIEKLEEELDEKMARRMINGEWLEIAGETIYYNYSRENNFVNESFTPTLHAPIRISWDFNIGEGKPLSAVIFQVINDTVIIFDEVVVEGMRTEQSCEQLAEKGILDYPNKFIIHGDATGKARDTRSRSSDYEIIKKFFSNYKTKGNRPLHFEMQVPRANPPIRKRHNLVNAYCKNAKGQIKLFVYRDAPTADEGLRLTKLKDTGLYIEDDSFYAQHISTAIGYGINSYENHKKHGTQVSMHQR